ncbi:MAG TPA: Gfo/Idh/MocA family oxidoreductase [Planctomycetota bacterium]|nr:Gfo/Idh/MocA family oxidoreductase [Planctomycetota bacterium]
MAIRVGVVGIGFMGKTHIGIYAKNKKAKLHGYCDFDPRRAAGKWNEAAGNLGGGDLGVDPATLKAYRKPEEMFADPEIDLVDLCLPTYVHAEYVLKALAAGKHVLCEKPLTVDLKDAERVAKAAKKAKGFMMPAHCMRFWPEWVWLKQAVQSKKFGNVQSAVFRRFASTPKWTANNWILQPELSGSALFDLHIHDTDFVRFVFGDPKAVFSVGNGGKATKNGIDHVVTSYLYRDPKLVVVAEGGWNADPTYGFTMRYTVVFDKATLDFDIGREGKVLMLHKAGAKEPEVVSVPAVNGWEEEIDYFLTCIQKRRAPTVTTAADAVESVRLVHLEQESVRKRKIIKV